MARNYHTVTKSELANAYGYAEAKTVVSRIERRIQQNHIDEKVIKRLGDWRGHLNLLPFQVRIIVENILDEPQRPDLLYTEK